MRYHEITEKKDELDLPSIEVGDEVMVGKFKNRKATVKGFTKDEHNQPVLKTNKGDQKLFKPRISKLEEDQNSLDTIITSIEQKYGVAIKYQLNGRELKLENIDRVGGAKGNGGLALEALIAYTDQQDIDIRLTVDQGHPRLVEFYLKHGFVPDDHPSDLKAWLNDHSRKWHHAAEYEPDEDEDYDDRPELPWVNMVHQAR